MQNRKLWIATSMSVALLLLAVGLVLSLVVFSPSVAQAQPQAQTSPSLTRTITVVGEGSVKIKPDVAQATIGVEVMAPTVQEAGAETERTMNAVLEALKQQGVDEKDIQTSGFSIWADRSYGPEGRPGEDVVYRVSNNVIVTIRDLDQVEAVLDAAIEAGANNIFGVNFSLADPSQVESEARQKAVADAEARAQELAELNGVQMGEVVSISEVIGTVGGYYPGSFREAQPSLGLGGGGGPISPGELELTMQLQIVYAIE